MDGQRFDALARGIARGTSRRQVLKGLAGAALGGALISTGAGRRPAAAAVSCTLGGASGCAAGQECCPVHNAPGETICIPAGRDCAQQGCAAEGAPCLYAGECCTDGASCTGNVCTGPGGQCAPGAATCRQGSDCCSGKCNSDGICYCTDPDRPPIGCPCTAGDTAACGGSPELCCGGTCISPMATCYGPGQCAGVGDSCSTDGDCCAGTCHPERKFCVCAAGSAGCTPPGGGTGAGLPNTGSGPLATPDRRHAWLQPLALFGAGAALVGVHRRRSPAPTSER